MKRIGFFALLMGVLMSFTNPTGYKVGDMAADFKLKSVDNKMYSMSDYKDAKGFIVVFTCNHCPFAVKWWMYIPPPWFFRPLPDPNGPNGAACALWTIGWGLGGF